MSQIINEKHTWFDIKNTVKRSYMKYSYEDAVNALQNGMNIDEIGLPLIESGYVGQVSLQNCGLLNMKKKYNIEIYIVYEAPIHGMILYDNNNKMVIDKIKWSLTWYISKTPYFIYTTGTSYKVYDCEQKKHLLDTNDSIAYIDSKETVCVYSPKNFEKKYFNLKKGEYLKDLDGNDLILKGKSLRFKHEVCAYYNEERPEQTLIKSDGTFPLRNDDAEIIWCYLIDIMTDAPAAVLKIKDNSWDDYIYYIDSDKLISLDEYRYIEKTYISSEWTFLQNKNTDKYVLLNMKTGKEYNNGEEFEYIETDDYEFRYYIVLKERYKYNIFDTHRNIMLLDVYAENIECETTGYKQKTMTIEFGHYYYDRGFTLDYTKPNNFKKGIDKINDIVPHHHR